MVFILIGLTVSYSCFKTCNQKQAKFNKPSLAELRKQWKKEQSNNDYDGSFIDFSQQRLYELKKQVGLEQSNSTISSSHPWLAKKEWRNNRIRSGAKNSLMVMWGVTVFWNGISSPLLFVLDDEIKRGNYAALIGLLFPLVGLFLIKKAWLMTREWKRYGVIELEMDPFPGSIGGHVGGSLIVKNFYDFNGKYKSELECVYSYVSGSGDSRSRKESIKWAEGGFAKVESAGNGVRLKFRFDVPEHLPEADIEQKRAYYFWRLKVSSDLSGIDLNREYNIPVFKTQVQSKYIRHDISAQAKEIREDKAIETQAAIDRGDFASTALTRALRFKDMGSKQLLYFPMFRNKILTLFALIFGGGFGFAAYSINQSFGDGGVMSVVMFLFSLPFALVGLVGGVGAIYLPFNNLSITLADRKIKAVRRLFIFPIKYDEIASHEIKKMEVKSSGSIGQGVNQVKHYKVIAHTTKDKKITIAEDIDGEDLANQFKNFISKQLLMTH